VGDGARNVEDEMNSRRAIRTAESAASRQQNVLSKERLDDSLDDALADTFPASDPVASPPSDAAPEEGDRLAPNQSPAGAPTSQHSRR
jgi:hypothetical protein